MLKCYKTCILQLTILFMIFAGVVNAREPKSQQPKKTRRNNTASLYERIDTRLKNDPDFAKRLESTPEELKQVSWMVGNWNIVSKVFATPSSPERISEGQAEIKLIMGDRWLFFTETYPDGGVDESYLTYNNATQQWTTVTVDITGNALVASAKKWEGNRLVFLLPDAKILGEHVVLRQTLEKRSDTEYYVLNEERLPNGRWVALDEYTYKKRP